MALFFSSVIFHSALAQNPPPKGDSKPNTKTVSKETYKDIINKAYNLSLQKDRSQAIALLLGALKREGKKTGAQKELAQALDQVAKVFISDKAQQQYELGLSLKFSDPSTALGKLNEAARLEPENSSIEIAIAQQQMMLGDCDGANGRASKYKELAPYLEDWRLVNAQTFLCENKFEAYLALKQSADQKSPLAIFWLVLEAEYMFRTNQAQRGKDSVAAGLKLDPVFPENLYWDWKLSQQLKLKGDRQAQKYISTCKTLNSRQQRSYAAEPFLCRRTAEVETFLKNNNNAEL